MKTKAFKSTGVRALRDKQGLVEALAEEAAQEMGLILVAVEVLPGLVRVFADGDGGITVGECSQLSRKIGQALDHEEIFDEPYVLEVSSPGLDRVLKTRKELNWAVGKRVKLMLKDGSSHQGTLEAVNPDTVSVDGKAFAVGQIAKISLNEVA